MPFSPVRHKVDSEKVFCQGCIASTNEQFRLILMDTVTGLLSAMVSVTGLLLRLGREHKIIPVSARGSLNGLGVEGSVGYISV